MSIEMEVVDVLLLLFHLVDGGTDLAFSATVRTYDELVSLFSHLRNS
jgi:hypothetical protein